MDWKRLKQGAARLAGALGLISLAACTTAPPLPPGAARPALWKLADQDTTIYLFGTIHVLPKDVDWRTPALEQAIASSQELVLETETADLQRTAQVMMSIGVSPGLKPLRERVPEAKRARLDEVVAASGFPMAALDRMETWAAALMLTAASLRKMGLATEQGVEQGLAGTYEGAKKKVLGLETAEIQLGFFDKLSEQSQLTLLDGALEDPAEARKQFEAMMAAWRRGDVDAIARTFDEETLLNRELREVLMTRRNAVWANWLAKRLDQPGTLMVAVGAGHLAGQDSVQAMLKARGFKVQRVQ